MTFRLKASAIAALAALFSTFAMPSLVLAASYYPDHCSETGFPGVKSCPTPPLAVANRAIPEELQSWGVPPVPNAKKDSEAYTQWYKAYFLTKRTVQPYGAFRVGNSSFGFDTSKTGIQFNNENATSNQPKQSGYGLAKSLTAPASLILNFATANFVAPSAAQVNPCSGQYTQSEGAFWLGIDGISAQSNIVSSSDVLQVGLIDDIICEGNNIFQVLTPFIEFYPNPPICVPFNGIKVVPGDMMLVQVAQASTPTQGLVSVADLTQNMSTAYSLQAASGYPYNGYSAETFAERACTDTQGASCNALPDFGTVLFTNATATDSTNAVHPLGTNAFGLQTSAINLYSIAFTNVIGSTTYATPTKTNNTSVGSVFVNSGSAQVLSNTCNYPMMHKPRPFH